MGITLIGAVVLLAGFLLLFVGGFRAMLAFVMITTLFGGSAAISLGATGRASSIPPANLALLFIAMRALLPGHGQMAALRDALRQNVFLVVFALYGAVTAWILPRIFAGQIRVTPLHPGAIKTLFESAPLRFGAQNITTSIYLLGGLIAGVTAYIGASRPGGAQTIVRVGLFVAFTHATLGFVSIVVNQTPLDVFIEFFRNGNYAQLDQSFGDINRMSGIWPEASGFAAYGGGWFVFMTELWLRDVRPRATGAAALLMGVALLISTSSTAYVTLIGYTAIFIVRSALLPWTLPLHKALRVAATFLVLLTVALAATMVVPTLAENFGRILTTMTVDKTQSLSGRQRAFWAAQGLSAFVATGGLGIGAGSFRSSSLLTAILGSMGVIGAVCFVGHLLRAFKPLHGSTYFGVAGDSRAVGSAASWAALLMLMPAAVSAPSPDPGLLWGMFCGFALALRREPLAAQGGRRVAFVPLARRERSRAFAGVSHWRNQSRP